MSTSNITTSFASHAAAFSCVIALPILSAAGCGTAPLCEPSFKVGQTHEVRIAEAWTASGPFSYDSDFAPVGDVSCAAFDGINPGIVVKVLPLKSKSSAGDGGCGLTSGEVSSLPLAVYEGGASRGASGRGSFFSAAFKGTLGTPSCKGDFVFGLSRVGSGGPESTPVAGQKPPIILLRWFYPAGASVAGCTQCGDAFVAQQIL